MAAKKNKWLINGHGVLYGYTQILAKRKEMREFFGTLRQAQKEACKPFEDSFPTPAVIEPISAISTGGASAVDEDVKSNNILAAITMLDKTNPEHYTQDGKPRVEAIEQIMGDDITLEDRDLAIAEQEPQQGLE